MLPDTTYVSLGISPNADGIVWQTLYSGQRPHFSFVVAFADVDSRFMGILLLTGLKAYFPMIDTLADALIPDSVKPVTVPMDDYSGRKRDLHLRIYVISEARSLVIRRFNKHEHTGAPARQVMLGPLMEFGPEAVVDFVGQALLDELTAMHPDVFAHYGGFKDTPLSPAPAAPRT